MDLSRNLLTSVSPGLRDLGRGSPRLRELDLSHNSLAGAEQILSIRHVGRELVKLGIASNPFTFAADSSHTTARRLAIMQGGAKLQLVDGVPVTDQEREEAVRGEGDVLRALAPPQDMRQVEALRKEVEVLRVELEQAREVREMLTYIGLGLSLFRCIQKTLSCSWVSTMRTGRS